MGSATQLPFPSENFREVWSFGLFHHLPDKMAQQAFLELIRVCAPKGYVVVFDAVLPIQWWLRPLAAAICRGDRGKFIRSQTTIKSLLPKRSL